MRTSTLATLTALLLLVVAVLVIASPESTRLHTTAMLDAVHAPPQDGTGKELQPERSTDEAKAYVWIAKFAIAKFK